MLFKILTSALIISLASWLARKKTVLAGFIVIILCSFSVEQVVKARLCSFVCFRD